MVLSPILIKLVPVAPKVADVVPITCNFALGPVVPMPTLPLESIRISSPLFTENAI